MKKLRKSLSLLLTLTMVLSLFCGMSTVAHAAALDVKIYDQDGISVSLSREIEPVRKKDVKFTVIIDGTTVLSEMNVSGVALTANKLSVEAEGYTVTYKCEHATVAAGVLTLNANVDDEYSVIINLASKKKQDAILIADGTTEYGTFHWQKNNAGNTAFQRNVTVYVNNEEKYTKIVNTPKNLTNGGTNNQYWFTPNTQEFKSEYSMTPPYSLGQVTNRDLSIYLTTKCGCGRGTCLCEGGCPCPENCECGACMGKTLGENQIDTGYGILEYKQPGLGGGYNLTVEVYVNGQKKFTSNPLRIKSGENDCLNFQPGDGYYYHYENGYDLDTKNSGSSWVQSTGFLSIVGVLDADRNYPNLLKIYLWTFENGVQLDVERRPGEPGNNVTGYIISYDAFNPETNQEETYTYEATSFLVAQSQRIPIGTPVALTAICENGKEVTQWSTADGYANAIFTGIRGGNGSTEAYGNTAYLTVKATEITSVTVYIDEIGNVAPPTEEQLKNLLDDQIKVICTNTTESHSVESYSLDLSSVTRPTGVTGNALNKYAYELTIKSDSYVKQYNQTVGKDHTPASETKTVTLEYDGKSWTVQAGDTPAEFKVACSTIPDPAYTLTYDANGGYWGTASDTTRTETDLPTPDETDGWHTLSYSDAETAPTHDPVNETDILFVGWTLDQYKRDILDKDATEDDVPLLSTKIYMNWDYKVYAVWAEDSNDNGVPDYQEKAITVNFNLKDGTTTDTTSFTLKPFPEKTDIKFGTAPAVTPPTGQEFVNWTLQSDPTESLGDKAYFTYKTIFEMTGGKETTVTFEANYQSSNAITITPADITIYMGGDGYEGTVTDEEGDMAGSGTKNGFPEPGFTVTLPQSLKDADMSKLFLRYEEADVVSYTWKFEKYGEGNHNIYRIVPVEGTASRPVRLEFKKGDLTITEDTFDVNLNLNQTLDMTVYGEGIDQELVFFEYEGNQYDISVGIGKLTVRGTSDQVQYGVVNEEIADGAPGLKAESGTTYVVNDSTVTVEDPSGIALLFDDVIETNTVEDVTNTDLLKKRADTYLGGADPDRQYEFKYLDLVDQNNGNAWVKANGTLTVYWPLPANADPDTLQILHFADVDRSTEADDIADEISGCDVEKVTIKEVTGTHVVFEVTNSSFSPFALVYETKTTPPQETVTVTFKVVNGTWSNGSSSNIEVTVPKDGSLTTRQIPTGMKPNSGYEGGSWDTTPNTNRKLNSNVTYTYTFTKSGDTEPEDEDCILYFESNGGTEFQKIDNGNDSFRINPYSDSEYGQHIPSRPGYRFTGWYRDEDLENRISESTKINVNSIMTIYAGWERTSVPSMLNGDDHYAYIQGYADGTVRPNANITRAQVATIFFRLLDEDVRSDYLTTYNTFPDVNADYWANTAISTMASLGVINGRNSGLFDPDAYITRAEFAAICARFDDSNVSGFDSFTDTFGHWAEEEIGRAAALGWIQGYDDGTFRPNQYITRAQAVTMINRVLCRLPEDEDDLLPGMSVWTDCREGDWCYLAIQEATNSHDYVTKDRVYETWTDLNRAPDWSRYE